MYGSAIAPLLTGLAGWGSTRDEDAEQTHLMNELLKAVQGVELPEYQTDLIDVPTGSPYYTAADLTAIDPYEAALQEVITQGPSALSQISTDPQVRAKQMIALEKMAGIADEGLRPEDEARLEQALQRSRMQERGAREAILQDMQARGTSGSGLELAAQLANQQGAAERARMEALDINALASQRALEALAQSGDMAGQLRGQDWREAAAKAEAQDAIARFNAQQSANVQAANVAAKNEAAQLAYNTALENAMNQQKVQHMQTEADYGAGQKYYQNVLGQQEYQNKLQSDLFGKGLEKAGALQKPTAMVYGDIEGDIQEQKDLWSGMGGGVAELGGADEDLSLFNKPKQTSTTTTSPTVVKSY
jgi:hypothetical protein